MARTIVLTVLVLSSYRSRLALLVGNIACVDIVGARPSSRPLHLSSISLDPLVGLPGGSRELPPGRGPVNRGVILMATMAFTMPIIPGKEALDRESIQQMAAPGPDHDAYVAARRAQGIKREAVWHQATPNGTMAIVVMEADDPASAMGHMATSDDPFAQRFRELVKEVHGVDLASDPPPSVELISDVSF